MDLMVRAAAMGQHCVTQFEERLGDVPCVANIRGRGMMMAIELASPCAELVGKALEAGLLINVTADSVIRLLPPMVMSDDELGEMIEIICNLVTEFGNA